MQYLINTAVDVFLLTAKDFWIIIFKGKKKHGKKYSS